MIRRSVVHVGRIKNQHQPISLPKWSMAGFSSSHNLLDNSDNMSMVSFSQRSVNNLNMDSEFNNSRLSIQPSTRSRISNNGDNTNTENK